MGILSKQHDVVSAAAVLYADIYGVVSIPHEIAARIPEAAAQIRAKKREIFDLCQSPGISLKKLVQAVQARQ